jgi:hypothetical protein
LCREQEARAGLALAQAFRDKEPTIAPTGG